MGRLKEQRITWWQVTSLIIVNKLAMLTTYAPIVTAVPATRDAWLSALLAMVAALPLGLVSYSLMCRFPGQNIFHISRIVLGEWLGRLVNIAMAGLFVFFAIVTLRQFSEVFVGALMPDTPLLAFSTMMLLLSLIGTYSGFEVVARIAEVTAPVVVVGSILGPALSMPHMEFGRLLPLFEHGWGPMLYQSLTPIGVFGEVAWTLYLAMPFLGQPREARRSLFIGLGVNGLVVSIGAAAIIAVLGPAVTDLEAFPTLTVTRLINIAEFITRVEWLIAGMWMGAMYVKLSLMLFALGTALKEGLGLPTYRWPLLPVSAIVLYFAQSVFQDIPELIFFFHPSHSLPISVPVILGLPLLLLVGALLRGLPGRGPGKGGSHGAQA